MKPETLKQIAPFALLLAAVALYAAINPLRAEHVAVACVLVALGVASRPSRELAVALAPMAVFGWMYDLLRLFQERSFHAVSVEPVYRAEQAIFGGMGAESGSLGPVDFFREHHHVALDVLGGLIYSTHVPAAIGFGLILWWWHYRGDEDEQPRVHRFMWGFLLMNALGFAFMAAVPVAPPWYVELHGLSAPGAPIAGNPAGLARVDALLGYEHFGGIYGEGAYVFGAMPSLHVASPVWIALWTRKRWVRAAGWLFAAVMSFYAVYLTHHYVLDVVAGAALAVGVYAAMTRTVLGDYPDRLADFIRRTYFDVLTPRLQEATGE